MTERDGTHAPNADLNVFDPFSVNALAFHSLSALLFFYCLTREKENPIHQIDTLYLSSVEQKVFSLQVASA